MDCIVVIFTAEMKMCCGGAAQPTYLTCNSQPPSTILRLLIVSDLNLMSSHCMYAEQLATSFLLVPGTWVVAPPTSHIGTI